MVLKNKMAATKQTFPNGIVVEKKDGFFTIFLQTREHFLELKGLNLESSPTFDVESFSYKVRITPQNCRVLSTWIKKYSSEGSITNTSTSASSPSFSSKQPFVSDINEKNDAKTSSSSQQSNGNSNGNGNGNVRPPPIQKLLNNRKKFEPNIPEDDDFLSSNFDDNRSEVSTSYKTMNERQSERFLTNRRRDFDSVSVGGESEFTAVSSFDNGYIDRIRTLENEINDLKKYIMNDRSSRRSEVGSRRELK